MNKYLVEVQVSSTKWIEISAPNGATAIMYVQEEMDEQGLDADAVAFKKVKK